MNEMKTNKQPITKLRIIRFQDKRDKWYSCVVHIINGAIAQEDLEMIKKVQE